MAMSQPATRRSWSARIMVWLRWGGLAALYLGIIAGICFLIATLRPYYLPVATPAPTIIYARDGKPLANIFAELHLPVRLTEIPIVTLNAVLAAEDAHFFAHNGLDWHGLLREGWAALRTGRLTQEQGTITQQLVRMTVPSDRPALLRQVQEALLSVRVERAYDKREILERYLNTVYFGGGVYGLGAAAQWYFGKTVEQITPAESAVLAALISSAGDGDPRAEVAAVMVRQRAILALMLREHWLTPEGYQLALAQQINVLPHRPIPWTHPYVVDMVRRQLIAIFGHDAVYREGLAISTTIDTHLQEVAEQALAHAVSTASTRHVTTGAIAAIEPSTGAIRALVGGVNYWESPLNRALQTPRDPGSAFSVFVYQAAIDRGYLLFERAVDAPFMVGLGSPANFAGSAAGVVTLQTALTQSMNSVAVRLTQELTPGAVVTAAKQAGITSPLSPDENIAPGSVEVTPLEMARAFATYANSGYSIDPNLIAEIHTGHHVLYRAQERIRQTVNPVTAFLLTQGLQQALQGSSGKDVAIGRPAAGIHGTGSALCDAWCIGYTPNLSTAVWLGNDDWSPMAGVDGSTLPAQVWTEFMTEAHRGLPVSDFPVPAGVRLVTLCADSHQLALPVCPHTFRTYLPLARIPQVCQLHYWVTRRICVESGKLATPNCPVTEERTFAYNKVPTEYCPLKHTRPSVVQPSPITPQPGQGTTSAPLLPRQIQPAPSGPQKPGQGKVPAPAPSLPGVTEPSTTNHQLTQGQTTVSPAQNPLTGKKKSVAHPAHGVTHHAKRQVPSTSAPVNRTPHHPKHRRPVVSTKTPQSNRRKKQPATPAPQPPKTVQPSPPAPDSGSRAKQVPEEKEQKYAPPESE